MDDVFSAASPTDSSYIRLRDEEKFAAQRRFCETLWHSFHDLADSEFVKNMGIQFQERFWEMYLGATLRKLRFKLSSADEGPDLQIVTKGPPIWIEAVAPNQGNGSDAVYEVQNGTIGVPEDEILLRIRNSIYEKHDTKYKHYLSKGTVSDEAPYVIAINAYSIPHTEHDPPPTYIMQALFGIGNEYGVIDTVSGNVVEQGFRQRREILKRSGSPVSTDVFEDLRYSGISAIIYSRANVFDQLEDLGSDFQLVRNPHAANPIPRSWLRCGREVWAAQNTIETITWNPQLTLEVSQIQSCIANTACSTPEKTPAEIAKQTNSILINLAPEFARHIRIVKRLCNVRKKPIGRSTAFKSVHHGACVEVLDKRNHWRLIRFCNDGAIFEGWVRAKYLKKLRLQTPKGLHSTLDILQEKQIS